MYRLTRSEKTGRNTKKEYLSEASEVRINRLRCGIRGAMLKELNEYLLEFAASMTVLLKGIKITRAERQRKTGEVYEPGITHNHC